MENLNLPPFYVGQRVVCIESSVDSMIKLNSEYVVIGIKKMPCGCWVVSVEKGMGIGEWRTRCFYHRNSLVDGSWYDYRMFAPIEERFISFAEVIAIESQLIGAN